MMLSMSSTYTQAEEEFEHYKRYLNKWFWKPPIQAVELTLTLYVAHFCLQEKPIWCQILGPSSIGKSRIILDPMKSLPNTRFVDTINRNTFLSGWKGGGILNDLKDDNIFVVFSDFSTFLGLDETQRAEVQGQLRRYADMGAPVKKDLGNTNIEWAGKMTIVAGCTPAIENYWALNRDLGERFLNYKIPYEESVDDQMLRSEYSRKQIGTEKHINKQMEEYVKRIVGDGKDFPGVDTDISLIDKDREIDKIAILVALLRRTVNHQFLGGKRQITNVSPSEGSGRLTKQLTNLAVGNAMLFRNPYITRRGIELAKETALYTVPVWRYRIVANLLKAKDSDYTLMSAELRKQIGICRTSFEHTIDDLREMEILETESSGVGTKVRLVDEIIELAESAKMNLNMQRYSALSKKPRFNQSDDTACEDVSTVPLVIRPVRREFTPLHLKELED